MSRRNRRPSPPRCRHCHCPIRFFLSPSSSGWKPFDPDVVDAHESTALTRAYPVMGRKAWDFNELLAEVQVMRGCDVDEAASEVMDMDWFRLHRCWERVAAAIDQKTESVLS